MNKKILEPALKKFKKLKKKYKGFTNVGVDNWRGYRYIFDTEDVKKCKNKCLKCRLYLLLEKEKEGIFSPTLYLASKKDKKLFGQQNFLNCKTLKQYQNCYANFLIKKTKTKKEIKDELVLVKNFKIIFSKEDSNLKILEKEFQKGIMKEVLLKVDKRRGKIIRKLAVELGLY